MLMDTVNPSLSLKRLNEIEDRFKNNKISEEDLNELDFFIASILNIKAYLKTSLLESGFRSFHQYLSEKSNLKNEYRVAVGKVDGTIDGMLTYLKDYVIKNGFYL